MSRPSADVAATYSLTHPLTYSPLSNLRRFAWHALVRRFAAGRVEPLRLEFDPRLLRDCLVRGECDHCIAERDRRRAMRLVLGCRVANAPCPVFDLFFVTPA